MNKTIEKRLDRFLFPVGERAVFVDDDKTYKPTKHYKAIVREDNGKLVSIMKDSYQLVPNREVIMPLLEQLHNLDTNWIKECDVVVAEVSTPSHGVGYEIGFALNLDKPVICLFQEDRVVSKMILGNQDPNLTFLPYSNVEDVLGELQERLGFLQRI